MPSTADLYRPPPAQEGELLRTVSVGAFLTAALVLLYWSMDQTPQDRVALVVLIPGLAFAGVALIRWSTREDGQDLQWLYVSGLLLKMAAVVPRYYVSTQVYERVDALAYVDKATNLAAAFGAGTASLSELLPTARGTAFIDRLVATTFVVTGPATLSTFLLFTWIGFWGLFLIHRALIVGFPEANARRYGLFLFLLPTHLFWPSSIGKDAWMLFTVGVMAYGAACLLERRRGGVAYTAIGAVGAAMVRPHVALLAIAALTIAYLFRSRASVQPSLLATLGRIIVALVLVGGVVVLAARTGEIVEVSTEEGESRFSAVVDEVQRRSTQGGSAVDASGTTGIGTIAQGPFTVLFRPLVTEADSLPTLISALEGTFLLAALVYCWRRVFGVFRWLRRRPYVAFSLAYLVGFTLAFSNVGNLGILARQRAQVLPFLLILLVVPRKDEIVTPDPAAEPAEALRR